MENIEKSLSGTSYGKLILKGTFGAVPIVGSMLSEIIGAFPDKFDKRKLEFLVRLNEELEKIKLELNEIKIAQNELFLDTILNNQPAFIKTSDEETKKAIINSIVSVALDNEKNYDESMHFNRILINLSGAHLRALKFYSSFRYHSNLALGDEKMILNYAVKQLSFTEDIFKLVTRDLISNSLLEEVTEVGTISAYFSGSFSAVLKRGLINQPDFPLSPFGLRFVEYIRLHKH
jgi:hypothetical protein